MTDKDGYRYCDRCGVFLTKHNNKHGYEICDKCNEKLERYMEEQKKVRNKERQEKKLK